MPWRTERGDRRGAVRFEVMGTLHGTAVASQPVHARNVSDGGMLVESPCPMPLDSVVTLTVAAPRLETEVQARVRHVVGDLAGFCLGLEFLTISPALLQFIRDWLASDADPRWPPTGLGTAPSRSHS